jgi:hypothetical protein
VKSVFEIEPDMALEARLDAEAKAACQAGRVVSHVRVSAWLEELAKGQRVAARMIRAGCMGRARRRR